MSADREPRPERLLAALRLKKAGLLERLGRPRAALAQCRAALRADGNCWKAHERRARLLAQLGSSRAAWQALSRAIRSAPRSRYLLLMQTHRLEELGLYAQALAACKTMTRSSPRSWEAWGKRYDLESKLGRKADALASLRRACRAILRRLGPRPDSPGLLMRAAEMLSGAGEHQRAFCLLRRALRFLPGCAPARLRLAELYLWLGRPRAAQNQCRKALDLGADSARLRRSLGAALVMQKKFPEAVAQLDLALAAGTPDLEAYVWRAEARHRMGEHGAALDDLARCDTLADEALAVPTLAALARIALARPVAEPQYALIRQLLPAAWRAVGAELSPRRPRASRGLLERILARLGGNRSAAKTHLRGRAGRPSLAAYRNEDAAADFILMQTQIRSGDLEGVLSKFAALPPSNLLHIHRGEVLLWAGRYREARADFREALRFRQRSRWTRVGLGAAQLLLGDRAAALRCIERGVAEGAPPRSWLNWRGEAHRLAGRCDLAVEDLRESVALTPRKIGAWINLALALDELGAGDESRRIFLRLRDWTPHFLSVAARAAGAGTGREPRARSATLLKALELMRGNRSSWLYTYADDAGRIHNIHARLNYAEAP
ncbi:MAG: tetratricopeptide repeat protein [Elusimicrobia bacterium]|nr:tetratricopeptide repeat protein [Elusimicrobiota bacterium]